MPRDYDEKRDFIRVSVDCEIWYKPDYADTGETGRVANLSGRGMMFIADHELPKESVLEIKIKPENHLTNALHALVRVVRTAKQRRGKGYEIGAIIQKILGEDEDMFDDEIDDDEDDF